MIGNLKNNLSFYNIVAYLYLAAFVIGGFFFTPNLIFYIGFSALGAIFVLMNANRGLKIIVLLTMIFERFFTLQSLIIENQIYKLYPLDIIIVLTVIAFLFSLRDKKIKLFFGWPEKILLIYLIFNLIYLFRALYDVNAEFETAFSTFKNYFFYPLLYFLVIYTIQNSRKFKEFVHLIILAGLMIIFFIIWGFGFGEGLWTEFTPLSTSGVRLLASTHAFFLIITFILAVSLMIFGRFRNNSAVLIVLWIWLLGIFGSLMRHLWLALGFGLATLFVIISRTNKKTMARYFLKNGLALVSLFLIIFLITTMSGYQISFDKINSGWGSFKSRIISLLALNGDSSVNWRLDLWRSAATAWSANPLWGLGFGRKIPLETGTWRTFEEIRNLHNSPLAIMIQTGIAGMLIFTGFIAAVFIKSWRRICQNQELTPYYAGIFAVVLTILFSALFQPYLETNLTGIFFWLSLGLLRTSEITNE